MLPVLSDETTLLILLEDVADNILCDHKTCEKKATWKNRCEGCERLALICDPHKALHEARIAAGWVSMCKECGFPIPKNVDPWSPL